MKSLREVRSQSHTSMEMRFAWSSSLILLQWFKWGDKNEQSFILFFFVQEWANIWKCIVDGTTKVCMAMGHYIGRTRLENLQHRGIKHYQTIQIQALFESGWCVTMQTGIYWKQIKHIFHILIVPTNHHDLPLLYIVNSVSLGICIKLETFICAHAGLIMSYFQFSI